MMNDSYDGRLDALQREVTMLRAELRALTSAVSEAGEQGGGDNPLIPGIIGGNGIQAARVDGNWVISSLGGGDGAGEPMPLDLSAENDVVYARNGGFSVRVGTTSASWTNFDPAVEPWVVGTCGLAGCDVWLAVFRDGNNLKWDIVNSTVNAPAGTFCLVHVGNVTSSGHVTQYFHGNLALVAPTTQNFQVMHSMEYNTAGHALIGYKWNLKQLDGELVVAEQQDVTIGADADGNATATPKTDGQGDPVMTTNPVPFIAVQFVKENY